MGPTVIPLPAITRAAIAEGQPDWAVTGLRFVDYGNYICWEIITEDLTRRNLRCVGPVAVA